MDIVTLEIFLIQDAGRFMDVDATCTNNHDDTKTEPKQNGEPKEEKSRPPVGEMTSADYYFDSYAHFGKKQSLDFNAVHHFMARVLSLPGMVLLHVYRSADRRDFNMESSLGCHVFLLK